LSAFEENRSLQHVGCLYADHHHWLKAWLGRKVGDAFLASDLAQDTFVNIIKSGNACDIRDPRPFLVTIARRLLAHYFRRKLLESSYLEALSCLPEALAPSPESQLLAIEALQRLDRILESLPAHVSEAFVLAHIGELSYSQIATKLGVSESSVKQYLQRANRQCFFLLSD
jgi:RNA polymerase sigma factor (sigma-70 family)